MIVTRGLGSSSLIVTKGYGRKYLSPFTRIGDFERSVYKFIKENYADSYGYPVYYGNVNININIHEIWLYCNFSELNVETGKFSIAYIDVITKIASTDKYNTQLLFIIDDLRELFTNSDIDLYDFTYPEYPQRIQDGKIVIMREGKKRRLSRQVYERVEELKFDGISSLLQAAQLTVRMKLLKNYARSRTV